MRGKSRSRPPKRQTKRLILLSTLTKTNKQHYIHKECYKMDKATAENISGRTEANT
jgi:hypothetical protein